MKRVLAYVLAGLGGFLIVLAPVLRFYAVPSLAKAPLAPGDGGVTVSVNEGTAVRLFDLATTLESGELTFRQFIPVVSTRYTRGDVQAADAPEAEEQNLAVYDSFSRLTDADDTVLSAGTIRVAFDRTTSELTSCCGANIDGDEAPYTGINPLKFPFFVEKKTYDYFDTTLQKALPIEFVGEEDLFGMTVYRFEQDIPPTEYDELEVPGNLVGSDEDTVSGGRFYANVRTLWVDPVTGSIVKGYEEQKQTLRVDGTDRITLVEANVGGEDDEVARSVADAESSARLLSLLRTTVPLVSLLLGIVALAAGLLLARGAAAPAAERTVRLDGDQRGQYQRQ